MAGSRLEKLGTIFSRVTGLLRSGAMKEEDRPIWYDVYKAFPPKFEPNYERRAGFKEIKPIFYQEDIIRAKYYKKYGNTFGLVDWINTKSISMSQRFIEKHQELESSGVEGDIFKLAEEALRNEGLLTMPDRKEVQTATVSVKSFEKLNVSETIADIFKSDTK